MAPTIAQLERRLRSLLLACSDMDQVEHTAMYLRGEHPQMEPAHDAGLPFQARRTLETGLYVTYCRPFVESRGAGLVTLSRPSWLSDAQRGMHDVLLERRNQVYAHTDESPWRWVEDHA